MAIQWSTTSQAAATHGAKLLVYSEAGAGKTSLIATLPRPLVISAESGLLSLSRRNIERMYGVATPGISYDIPVATVKTIAQLNEVYQYVANPANRARDTFDSIAIDSATEVAEVSLANAKATSKDGRAAYGDMADHVVATIKLFRDIPGFHVYVSAKQAYDKDQSGLMKFMPMMPGKQVGPQLPYLFDEVFNLNVARTPEGVLYRYLRTALDPQYIAKDRSGMLDEIERPDLSHIIRKIIGA